MVVYLHKLHKWGCDTVKQTGKVKGRKANSTTEMQSCTEAVVIIGKIIGFLKLFMPETLAKRLVCMVLVVAGVPVQDTAELVGVCTKTVYSLRKAMTPETMDGLLEVKGGGRKRKLADVEEQIIGELEKDNYHTRQQVADMVWEKFQIKVSLPAIGRLLKKTASGG